MVRISVELPDEVAAALERAASGMRSTPAALLAEAAEQIAGEEDAFAAFAADKDSFEAWIALGEADVAAGRTASLGEATSAISAIIAKARAAKA